MISLLLAAQTASSSHIESFNVGGVMREALVFPGVGPAPSTGRPLILAFHGHGGNMRQAARSFDLQDLWPQAMVVYPQGLPTKGMTDPEGTKNGWQQKEGDEGNRDLKFVDTMLASVRGVDRRHIYSMGHSNGGRFTYLLWQVRGNQFAAYGPSSAPAIGMLRQMKPASAFIVAGETDPIVPYRSQEFSINGVAKIDGIDLSKGTTQGYVRLCTGQNGLELGTYIHPGGHVFPAEAAKAMVELFKRH